MNNNVDNKPRTLNDLLLAYIDLDEQEDALVADKDAYNAALADIDKLISSKLDSYMRLAMKLETREQSLQDEIDRLTARRDETKERRESIMSAIISAMRVSGRDRLESDFFSVKLKTTAGTIIIDDENQVPAEFWTVKAPKPPKPQIDKKSLKKLLTAIGDTEYAHIEPGFTLNIK